MADDVQLTDLEIIQRYSLAVRGATAPRADLVASLQADLDWLRASERAAPAKPARRPARSPVRTRTKAPAAAVSTPTRGTRS